MNTPAPSAGNGQRLRLLLITSAVLVIIAVGYYFYWNSVLRWRETTDDAYVSGNVVQLTPQIAGTVIDIGADDTQYVKQGQTLVRLDDTDAKVALDSAEAKLANTVRAVRGLFSTSAQLQANIGVRQADLDNVKQDLTRREHLAAGGAVSGEDVQHAREAVAAAQSALLAAKQQLAATRARIDGTTVADHPDVREAAVAVRAAFINLARTRLPAPVSGYVARRNVQLGQRVAPGSALLAVVPLQQVWVDANFKELQLDAMRVGQPVTLTADLYGGDVVYHGTVVGFNAGTGAAFALLPAQNATGNWIKVVQRVPVRVQLDPKEVTEHPLQIGLSMRVEVGTHDRSGPRLPQAGTAPGYQTPVFEDEDREADARIKAIIAANNHG